MQLTETHVVREDYETNPIPLILPLSLIFSYTTHFLILLYKCAKAPDQYSLS